MIFLRAKTGIYTKNPSLCRFMSDSLQGRSSISPELFPNCS